MSKILDDIRRAIEKSSHSRYAISKATGIDQAQLSRLVSGSGALSFTNLQRLLDFLELEIVLRPKPPKKKGS